VPTPGPDSVLFRRCNNRNFRLNFPAPAKRTRRRLGNLNSAINRLLGAIIRPYHWRGLKPAGGGGLTLRDITLAGRASNDTPLVTVANGGTLKLEFGAVIRDNTNSGYGGGERRL
jgi:hypothetical protein